MEISLNTLTARFLDYVRFGTQSDEENAAECPSTSGQLVLAGHLADELVRLGLSDVALDAHGAARGTRSERWLGVDLG